MLTALDQDIRYALRMLLRAPLLTATAVLSIAIGIGANAAIFSLVDQTLIRPLPVAKPRELVLIDVPGAKVGRANNDRAISYPMYKGLRDQNRVFQGMFALATDTGNLNYRGRSETVPVAMVSGTFFEVLGLRPAHGQLLGPADDRVRNGHPVAVVSHGYWKRRFGGDPSVVGQTVRINATAFQLVGVAPEGFNGIEFDTVPSVYVPLEMKNAITTTWDGLDDPNVYFLHIYGRLRPGLDSQQAKANLDSLLVPMLEEELKNFPAMPETARQRLRAKRTALISAGTPLLGEEDGETLSTALLLLMGIVALLLLIACANVANLLLARASAREREIAVRQALGAGQGRIMRQVMVESLLLALVGGTAGVLLSTWILDALIRLAPLDGASEVFLSAKPDWRVAAFCLVASLATGVLFGSAPAWQSAKDRIVGALKEHAGGLSGSQAQGYLRRALVVAQVTISLVLLVAAGLFSQSLMNLRAIKPGFNPDSLLTFRVDPSLSGYERSRAINFLDRFRGDLEALPGVRDVAVSSGSLLTNDISQRTMSIEGVVRREGLSTNARTNSVGPGYFRALGYGLLAGREFSDADRENSRKVAVVNEVFANEFFKGAAIGKRIGFGYNRDGSQRLDYEIVGVVRDGKHASLREKRVPRFVYVPYTQDGSVEGMTFFVRGNRDVDALVADARAALRKLDENMAMFRVQTIERTISESLVMERLLASLCLSFGLVATLLAAIGLYGVMAFNVARRSREIGIRLALGADRLKVVRMVMGEVGVLIAAGSLLGVPFAIGLGKVVESQLWNLKGWDPVILGVSLLVLGMVGLLAGILPAVRASRVLPMTALRQD
jgi:predicted permease